MNWVYNDGGRVDAGFRIQDRTRDCVVRAIAIVTERSYLEVFTELLEICSITNKGKSREKQSNPSTGIYREIYHEYLLANDFTWQPLMHFGAGCTVHLNHDELPTTGRYILRLSRHLSAYIDGVIHDTYDPSRNGRRCVYGLYKF